MTILSELKTEGWHLSNEGLDLCSERSDQQNVSALIKIALDMDLREIGGHFLTDDVNKGKMDSLMGPGVVQIQKIKNASAPKYEYGSGAPPLLRLLLTDGNSYLNCLQMGHWKSISLDTPPGTKLYLRPGKITVLHNFLLLRENQFTLLGGCVAPMVQKWELNRRLASHIRTHENLDGSGPPPWIPFGQPIARHHAAGRPSGFKSLESESNKEAKEDEVFRQQRQANIAEVARVKEAKARSFGGRREPPQQRPTFSRPDAFSSHTPSSQSSDYAGNNENEARRFGDGPQDSPQRNNSNRPPYQNSSSSSSRGRRGPRSEEPPPRQQAPSKDGRSKLGDFIPTLRNNTTTVTPLQQAYSSPQDTSNNNNNFPRTQYKALNRGADTRHPEWQDLSGLMDQVRIHGYDTDPTRPSSSSFKRGMEVMAKYWEDNQFYRAVIHAVGKEGKTCVVHFLDYGNYEEVLNHHIRPTRDKDWSVGPISFQPTPRGNEHVPQEGGGRYGGGRRTEYRPSARIYQPPSRRDDPHHHS